MVLFAVLVQMMMIPPIIERYVCCGGVDVLVFVDGTNLEDVLGRAHSLARRSCCLN